MEQIYSLYENIHNLSPNHLWVTEAKIYLLHKICSTFIYLHPRYAKTYYALEVCNSLAIFNLMLSNNQDANKGLRKKACKQLKHCVYHFTNFFCIRYIKFMRLYTTLEKRPTFVIPIASKSFFQFFPESI